MYYTAFLLVREILRITTRGRNIDRIIFYFQTLLAVMKLLNENDFTT